MAYQCNKYGGECDGCGGCEAKPVMYDYNDVPIYEGEEYYDFDGEIVSDESLLDWAAQFLKTAEADK